MVRERVFAQRRLSIGAAAFVDVTGMSDDLQIEIREILRTLVCYNDNEGIGVIPRQALYDTLISWHQSKIAELERDNATLREVIAMFYKFVNAVTALQ